MNNTRRKQLRDIQSELEALLARLEEVVEEEQEAYDNMPESLQESKRGERMADGLDELDEAVVFIRDCCDNIDNAIEA